MSSSWPSEGGVLIVEPQGRIRSANAAAERLLGYGRGELSGLDADKVLDGQRNVSWSKRKGLVLVHPREEQMPRQPPPVAAAAEMESESISLLENELLLIAGLAEMSLAGLTLQDPKRDDLERLTRAAARAAILCREATPVKAPPLVPVQLDSFLNGLERRLRSVLEPGVEITVHADSAAVLANAALLEQALVSLIIHLPRPHTVRLSTSPGGRIEASVCQVRAGQNPTWRRVLGERNLPRAAAWLAAQGAMLEEDIAEGGAGHRFRIHLAPAC